MATANVYGLWLPPNHFAGAGLSTPTAATLDAAGEKLAFIVQASKTGNIRKIHWLPGSVTTATDTDVRIETVDAATGLPTGTLFGATTNGTQLAAAITTGVTAVTTLTADAAVTAGTSIFAIVIAPTGTPNYIVSLAATSSGSPYDFPYVKLFAAAAWGDLAANYVPIVAIEYSDGTFDYNPLLFPITTSSSGVFNSGSTPDERGLKFRIAAPVRVRGFWSMSNLAGDTDFVLYDSDGTTALSTLTKDKDIDMAYGNNVSVFRFTSSISLLANTFYRLTQKPTTVTNTRLYFITVAAAARFDQMEGGQDFHWTERTDAGAWTDVTTKRPDMGLIIDGISDGVSAGGLLTHPGMTGGIRG